VTETELDHRVQSALDETFQRVRRLDLPDGRLFWLKRVERLTGVMRAQKGDPTRAFEAERAGLHALADAGLPVAELTAEGPDRMLMPDAGPILSDVVADPGRDEAGKLAAFAAAGRSMGRLHWAGLVHGRPAVRDICWDGTEARFIDLERFRPGARGGVRQAADVVMFAQTAFTQWPEDPRWLEAALEAYATNAPEGAMDRVRRLAIWLSSLGWVAALAARLKPESRELRAVGLTLARLRRA
jgi:tRNA A-37 threonylcarbamoyl transferase component Bud32